MWVQHCAFGWQIKGSVLDRLQTTTPLIFWAKRPRLFLYLAVFATVLFIWNHWCAVKILVLSLTTDCSCGIYNVHTKLSPWFLPKQHEVKKNCYYESCFCGFTMWCNSRLWFMLGFSLCKYNFGCFSQVWKEVSQTHGCCSHKPVCVRESETGRAIKS